MVEKLSEPTTGSSDFKDGDAVVVAVAAVNHQANEKLVVVEDEEEPMKGRPPPSSNNNKVWAISVKPFVNGGLAGLIASSQLYFSAFALYHLLAKGRGASQFKHLRSSYPTMFKRMPSRMLIFAAFTSVELGSFETLTRRVEAANKTMPLTLRQEVYCGLASGALAACIRTPVDLARELMASDATRSNVLRNLYDRAKDEGALALWKDGRCATTCFMPISAVGTLVSYNRSYNYFRESLGLDETGTILGAGAVSGFCGAACSMPIFNVHATMKNMRPDASGKYPYTGLLDCALKLWKSQGVRPFYAGFPKPFIATTMAIWWYFEEFRKKNPMD